MTDRLFTERLRLVLLCGAVALATATGIATLWTAPSAGAQAGATTTTQPVDNREFGDIIPEPNSGRPPETPGDPGGWMQVTLFFLICAAIVLIIGAVWWQSRRARARLAEDGKDQVSLARARGEGLRKPR